MKFQLQPVLKDHDEPLERDLGHGRPEQGRRRQPLRAPGLQCILLCRCRQKISLFTFLHVCLLFGRFRLIPVILIKSYHKQHFQVHYPRPTSLNSLKVVSSRRKIVFLLTGNFSSCLNWIFNKFWHWIRHISFVYYCLVFTNNHPFSPHCFLNNLCKSKSPSFSNIFLDA